MTFFNQNETPPSAEIGAFMALLAQKVDQSAKDYERTSRQYESMVMIVQEMDNRSDVHESDIKVLKREVELLHQSIDKQGSRIGNCEQEISQVKLRIDQWESSLKTIGTIFTILLTLAGLWFAYLQIDGDSSKKKNLPFFPAPSQEISQTQ